MKEVRSLGEVLLHRKRKVGSHFVFTALPGFSLGLVVSMNVLLGSLVVFFHGRLGSQYLFSFPSFPSIVVWRSVRMPYYSMYGVEVHCVSKCPQRLYNIEQGI